jgi:hypothetical protein
MELEKMRRNTEPDPVQAARGPILGGLLAGPFMPEPPSGGHGLPAANKASSHGVGERCRKRGEQSVPAGPR